MKNCSFDMDGEKFHIKHDTDSTGSSHVHIEIPDFDRVDGIYLSLEHAEILGRALIAVAKENYND